MNTGSQMRDKRIESIICGKYSDIMGSDDHYYRTEDMMTTTKYVCLSEGDSFITESEEEAREHMEMGEEHKVVEVLPLNGSVDANYLGDTGEELSEDELPDDEEMTEEEEEE